MFSIVTILALLPAAPPPADEYMFLLDTGRLVRASGSGYEALGWLDAAGNFVPNKSGWVGHSNFSRIAATPLGYGRQGDTVLPFYLLNTSLYEYRSGALIPGQMVRSSNFVPEEGGTVIDFRDYLKDYREGESRTIWNLPGYIYKKGTTPPRPSWQASPEDIEAAQQLMKYLGIPGPVGPIVVKPSPSLTPPFPLDDGPG